MPEKYRPEGSTVDYVIPSLDDPADGPVAFRDFADSIPPALSPVVPIHAKTADYTLVADDEGALVTFDCTAKDLNVTVPADKTHNLPVGSVIVVGCLGTNRKSSLTILAEEGVTLRDLAVRKVAWSRMAALIKVAADSWIINAGTGGGTPTSVPSPPTLLSAAAGSLTVGLQWKAPTDDGGAALTAYLIEISQDQKTWETGASTGPQTLATACPVPKAGTWYFRARAINANGISDPSNILSADVKPPYNDASGGKVTEIDNYNGTGEKWRVHRFDLTATFTVKASYKPFRVLAVGGGGGGGQDAQGTSGGRGGNGVAIENKDVTLPAGDYVVTVGNGGSGAGIDPWGQGNGGGGGASSISSVIAGGGGGGKGPGDQNHPVSRPWEGSPDGPQVTTDIEGSSKTYLSNSGSPGSRDSQTPCGRGQEGCPGGPGAVIVAYRIG